jgi:D-glycero-D-manno-heptose 1,7-bisphosphate phosphatase
MKVAFLDRDGVVNKEVNYLHTIDDFEYTENCKEGLLQLRNLGYEIVIITNQAGIAKGYFSEEQYKTLTEWMLNDLESSGIKVLECLFCPHHVRGTVKGYISDCDWRKPGTGMIDFVTSKYPVNLTDSILIGDKYSDIEAGYHAGVGRLFLVESGHKLTEQIYHCNGVFRNLYTAAHAFSNE